MNKMKILLIDSWFHTKNKNALLSYKNVDIQIVDIYQFRSIELSDYDVVYNPSEPMDISNYPNTKFLFGPHFSVFPDSKLNVIKHTNVVYTQPSEWAKQVWLSYNGGENCRGLKMESLPFGVDTNRFYEILPVQQRKTVFLYYKQRIPEDIHFMIDFLQKKQIQFVFFNYQKRYSEEEYIQCLQQSTYGIWVGRHESQGFALEEALSCNVPLFVWDVTSMNQEAGQQYADIPATAIPYWDERCGEFFHDKQELENKFQLFLSKLDSYRPREYVLENLSMEKCEARLVNIVNNIHLSEKK
jgi:hypothetical protein